jgi:hypothetical protein
MQVTAVGELAAIEDNKTLICDVKTTDSALAPSAF